MVTLIIPTLNEEKTVKQVIELVGKSSLVNEILVIDDKSSDDTLKVAKLPAVKLYTSTKLGKGASMRDGMLLAKNEVIVFLDADILTYPNDVVERLATPIINDEADLVKSSFDRQAGRVTELVAKPLLSILFPDLTRFSQPLSGMIAARKSLLKKVEFENDYGVDIGLLIDMNILGARITEVNIGYIENRMQSWEALAKMSREVSLSIIKRAKRIEGYNLETLQNMSIIRTQMDYAIREGLRGLEKMIIFDMDNTLLEDSFITTAAEAFGFKKDLIKTVTETDNAYLRTKGIAKLLKGKSIDEILNVTDSIPIIRDAEFVISELKSRGYICGIISDSYDVVTNHIKNKLGMDFSIGNELEFSRSIATGEVKVPSSFLRTGKSKCNHDFCKSNVLLQLAEQYTIGLEKIISIGDSENDICLIRESGKGIAFRSNNNYLNLIADHTISEKSFLELLDIAQ
ncbi:MAG: glycosyl transferase family 2 [Bacteroidetes bacterium GWE2_41_25]|nr:MAG: glycosyl transferase family 2 [Bacteroidetes bacterium GWA2_40_15]OFX93342.1 MAG: glycosyl transferase family 2 [Bacteroidetes bacterium GWE2_41_25]OFX97797.1 MAG: glycosyl transferase family 2 [Bacteroidetes bacterium GWC2_40_22]OFY60802.1 MAG: glycosyl transferase family 2 [Bacteroidetes bacterium GWF2_41_9]HBH83776.1 glycosyl transferase family 2 [Bacteroidales bacterium]